METLLKFLHATYRIVGDNLIPIILAIVWILVLLITGEAKAMDATPCGMQMQETELKVGDTIPCSMQLVAQESGICTSLIVTETGRKICPIVTPGQAIQNTLSAQQEEVP